MRNPVPSRASHSIPHSTSECPRTVLQPVSTVPLSERVNLSQTSHAPPQGIRWCSVGWTRSSRKRIPTIRASKPECPQRSGCWISFPCVRSISCTEHSTWRHIPSRWRFFRGRTAESRPATICRLIPIQSSS